MLDKPAISRFSHNVFYPITEKLAKPQSSVVSVQDLRTRDCWFDPRAWPIFFLRTDDSHCDRIHSSLTTVHCFDNGYVGKQRVAWKEYCAEYWIKEVQESMDRRTGRRDVTEILLIMALNTMKSINQQKNCTI